MSKRARTESYGVGSGGAATGGGGGGFSRRLLPDDFCQFADALRRTSDNDFKAGDVVDFGVPTLRKLSFYGPTKIFVRECYIPLLDSYIDETVEHDFFRVVVGNSGTGKLAFRLLVACKALQMGSDVAFVLLGNGSSPTFVVGSTSERDRILSSNRFVYEDVDRMVILADVTNGNLNPISRVASRCWYFTTPTEQYYYSVRHGDVYHSFWFPLWKLDELQSAARGLDLSLPHRPDLMLESTSVFDAHSREEIVECRYYQFGGDARVVLAEKDAIIWNRIKGIHGVLHKVRAGGMEYLGTLFNDVYPTDTYPVCIVGIQTLFDTTTTSVSDRYDTNWRDGVAFFDDEVPERGFGPVNWLSRPIREMMLRALIEVHVVADTSLVFLRNNLDARRMLNEQYILTRLLVAAESKIDIFHRVETLFRGPSRGARPFGALTPRTLHRRDLNLVRQEINLPNSPSSYDTMQATIRGCIEKVRTENINLVAVRTTNGSPIFDAILILSGRIVKVAFLKVTLRFSFGITHPGSSTCAFLEAALEAAAGDTQVGLVYILGDGNFDEFGKQTHVGTLASQASQLKVLFKKP